MNHAEILHNRLEYRDRVQESFTNPTLRASLEAELKDGRLIGRDAELGEDVKVEKGAAVLGQTRILKGEIEGGAVVVDCVIGNVKAKAQSMLLGIEQLNEKKVCSETGQLLTDVLVMDEGIVKKIRVTLAIRTPDQDDAALDRLLTLSDFEASYLGGSSAGFRQVLFEQPLDELFVSAGVMHRFEGNPILEPVPEHPWESKLVYNPAAIRLHGITYIVYRALGHDHVSRLGLAWSKDGQHISGRLPHPIFVPETDYELAGQAVRDSREREKGGCEDPRLTLIGDRVYMTYSAYGEVLQIALASIAQKDLIALPQTPKSDIPNRWVRYGPVFPGTLDRNAVLFPEKINGKFVMLRRPIRGKVRDIAISHSDTLKVPWPANFEVIMEARPGRWDSERVGAGAQVLKTGHGWLLIYHGVGKKRGRRSYMLGAALLDLNDPSQVLYRSPAPIFIPEQDYELYGWAPNVVFANGAVAKAKDADQMIEDDDEIIIYYGGGDRVIGVASAKLADLVPVFQRGRNQE